jgi:sulfur-oxidizing protein SoxY
MTDEIDDERRTFLRLIGGGTVIITVARITPLAAQEEGIFVPELIRPLIEQTFGAWDLQSGRVHLDLPVIAETGLSVPITFSVDSPMTEDDYVHRIMGFAPGNPEIILADYIIGPRAGRAEVSTRVRIAKTQTVVAAVLMSDGSRWGATFDITVTRGACIDDIFLPDLEAIQERERNRLLNANGANN